MPVTLWKPFSAKELLFKPNISPDGDFEALSGILIVGQRFPLSSKLSTNQGFLGKVCTISSHPTLLGGLDQRKGSNLHKACTYWPQDKVNGLEGSKVKTKWVGGGE